MTRPEGWEAALARVIEDGQRTAFAYQAHDCVTFAARAVEAATGRNPLGIIKAGWPCPRRAALLVDTFGGVGGCLTVLATCAGLAPRLNPWFAQRGDLVLIGHPETGETAGVCLGDTAAAAAPGGLAFLPRGLILRAWGA